ncbi:hypothetical protein GQ600_8794 [Phytophthora cactorum]|nr:hypothetical protein GQ600_8794 [Phytophthora cactorum]
MTLERAWEHWYCGDPSGEYGPYYFLECQDLSNSKKRKRLLHYRCLMMEVQTKVTEKAIWIDRPTIEEA